MIVKQEFMVGDIVRYIPMGDKEYVLEETGNTCYPLLIKSISTFTLDGRTSVHHTHPLLILTRRPEEKKKWYQVFYKTKSGITPELYPYLYVSEEDFYTRGISKNRLEWIELAFVCER